MPEEYSIYLLVGVITAALISVIVFVARKAVTKSRMPVPLSPSNQARARLVLPGSIEIRLSDSARCLGRSDLTRAVSINELGYISRRHFEAGFANGQYYIEDLNSVNGTKLNGAEIKGRGKQELKDGGQVMVADVITLVFRSGLTFP